MNIKNILILLFFSGILLSCNKDKDTEDLVNMQKAEYSFVKMEFITSGPGDMSEIYENDPAIIFANGTGSTQSFSFNPLKGTFESSRFSGIDSSVINHIINSPLIAVPINVGNDSNVSLGEAKWPISNTTERQKTFYGVENHFQIEPHKKMTLDIKIYYTEISTNIKLTLLDVRENKEHVFEGKWMGLYPKYSTIRSSFTEFN